MPRPSHSSRFVTRTILGEEYRSFSSSLCSKECRLKNIIISLPCLCILPSERSSSVPFVTVCPAVWSALQSGTQLCDHRSWGNVGEMWFRYAWLAYPRPGYQPFIVVRGNSWLNFVCMRAGNMKFNTNSE
jgi:hypothetical protein